MNSSEWLHPLESVTPWPLRKIFGVSDMVQLLLSLNKSSTYWEIYRYLSQKYWLEWIYSWTDNIPWEWGYIVMANHPYFFQDFVNIANAIEQNTWNSKIKTLIHSEATVYKWMEHLLLHLPENWDQNELNKKVEDFIGSWWIIIVFPAGEVSSRWYNWEIEKPYKKWWLWFAYNNDVPILPVKVDAVPWIAYNVWRLLGFKFMKYFNITQIIRQWVQVKVWFWESYKISNRPSEDDIKDLAWKIETIRF